MMTMIALFIGIAFGYVVRGWVESIQDFDVRAWFRRKETK